MTRFYNQRYEFAHLSSKLLLLFDTDNIRIFKKSKKIIRRLAKHVDESETWV
jgi:inositol 1,4,5-triphosphate receptor type 1/inositol 1,4,5-triphosphate receptor type 3